MAPGTDMFYMGIQQPKNRIFQASRASGACCFSGDIMHRHSDFVLANQRMSLAWLQYEQIVDRYQTFNFEYVELYVPDLIESGQFSFTSLFYK